MARPIGIAVHPSIIFETDLGTKREQGAVFVLLDNGEVWWRGKDPSAVWSKFGAVPNTPASAEDS